MQRFATRLALAALVALALSPPVSLLRGGGTTSPTSAPCPATPTAGAGSNRSTTPACSLATLITPLPLTPMLSVATLLQTKIPAGSGWTLLVAGGINNLGQINGYGIHNGNYRGFLLTPAP
jgi:hypothetical protein